MATRIPIKSKSKTSKLKNLRDLFIEQLRDIYSAENQLVKALPKLAKAVDADELKRAIESHLEETKGHVERLEEIFSELEEKPTGKKCAAMEGLVQEGKEAIEEDAEPAVKDAGIIAAAQRVEHYEIAAYGTVRTYAQLLGLEDIAETLQATLDEEGAADEKLGEVAEGLNLEANQEEDEE